MPDHPAETHPIEPGTGRASLRDIQRTALRDLLDLSTESAQAAESLIEQRYRTGRGDSEEEHGRVVRRIERRFKKVREEGQQAYDALVQKITAHLNESAERLNQEKKVARERIVNQVDREETRAKKKFDHSVWLADSVVEATQARIVKDYKRLKKDVAAKREALLAMEQRAQNTIGLYRLTPPEPVAAEEEGAAAEIQGDVDPATEFREQLGILQEKLKEMGKLFVPGLFQGIRPYAAVLLPSFGAAALVGWLSHLYPEQMPSFTWTVPTALGGVAALVLGLGFYLRGVAKAHVKVVYDPFLEALAACRRALRQHSKATKEKLEEQDSESMAQRDSEVQDAKKTFEDFKREMTEKRRTAHQQVKQAYARLVAESEEVRDREMSVANAWVEQDLPVIEARYKRYFQLAQERHQREMDAVQERYDAERAALTTRWQDGLVRIEALIKETPEYNSRLFPEWEDTAWDDWKPPVDFSPVIRFGELFLDLKRISSNVHQYNRLNFDRSAVIHVPALLAFPDRSSLLLETEREGLDAAIGAVQSVMARLLTALPPGRVHFTIIDAVGLGQNFAGFMHLADYEEALVGGRIWTDSAQIEAQLTDLTNHMENVIQKYLRNEFETIEDYNRQAEELAEPYRFLVIANFPVNFSEESARRLSSIVTSGARCGVYTLIAHDAREKLPPGITIEDLEAQSITVLRDGDRWVLKDEVFGEFALTLDEPPTEDTQTRIMHIVGAAAKDSSRVEVPFQLISPSPAEMWSTECTHELVVPIGRTGATRQQELRLGRGVSQHALIAGKTGSGKSTLLHVIVSNLAMWYSPEEVDFYLIDFKKGVEFKTYATHDLPHARAIAIESDREFGLSVLQRLDAEMERRGELFRRAGVQDLAGYRQGADAQAMPRTLLIIDEFQVFFSEDDKLAQDAAMLMDRLVRQGRAFGIHAIFGSQTLGGTAGLARSTIGQMAVRVALQCSEADSQLILDDTNPAARLLSRPGEAIYNDAGGLIEGNSPFQTAWLSDAHRDRCLDAVCELAAERFERTEPLIVFEGNAPADIGKNMALNQILASSPAPTLAPQIWLGDAIAIKEPTSATLRRQSGANLMFVGQRDDASLAMLACGMLGLAAQNATDSASFVVFDGTPPDSVQSGFLEQFAARLPQPTRVVGGGEVAAVLSDLVAEVQRRQDANETETAALYVIVYGLQRFRMLRREDEFSFSTDDAEKGPGAGKLFAELLREGPAMGVHVLAWTDTPASLERALDRQAIKEFDNRVLFQMSAGDSSNLIDSPLANRLGYYRVLFYSEEQGLLEKFRPYAAPEGEWLASATQVLQSR